MDDLRVDHGDVERTGSVGPDADVLIVGAGASGAVVAKRLGEDGFRVVCLEQGSWPITLAPGLGSRTSS